MDVGNEISQKIRSAIKAKLVELGAYVDEELPDYIMVMVANKKSQLQMSEDLGLFLGTNTDKFTTWLHSLLQKLQSITSETTIGKPDKNDKLQSKETAVACRSESSEFSSINTSKKRRISDESKPPQKISDELPESKKEAKSKRKRSDSEKKTVLLGEQINLPIENELTEKQMTLTISTPSEVENHSNLVQLQPEDTLKNFDSEKPLVITECKEIEKVEVKKPKDVKAIEHVRPTVADSEVHIVEEDDLSAELLLTENDELTEELEQEPAVLTVTKKKNESSRTAFAKTSDDESDYKIRARGAASVIISRSSTVDTSQSPSRSSRPRAVASPIRQSNRTAVVRAIEPYPVELFTRKRRAPVSVVGSVTLDSDDEEGYDPRTPAVGNVASVIKVTARKSSVPPKLQANKTLLLKAMTEAEKSVETQRRVAITPIRPFMRSDRRSRSRERDRERDKIRERDRERDRDHHERSNRSKTSSKDSGGAGSLRLAQTSLRQAITQSGSSRPDAPVYIPTRKVQPTSFNSRAREQVGLVSKSKMAADKQRAWLEENESCQPARKCIKREKDEDSIVNFVIEAEMDDKELQIIASNLPKIKQEHPSPSRESPVIESAGPVKNTGSDKDCRMVKYEPETVAPVVVIQDDEKISDSGSQGVPLLLEDMDQDEFVLDQDVMEVTETQPALLGSDLRHTMVKELKPKDKTRFVVTLDGIDLDQYDTGVKSAGECAEEMVMQSNMAAISPAPMPRSASQLSIAQTKDAPVMRSPPKIQPMNINLRDSDEEGEVMETEEITPLKQAKMMERCKFWPACVNGVACEYHHPTIHCKTFPMCKFGDKCLYIHPNCRFDSKCTRSDCPYTHSSRRSIPAVFPAPQIIFQALPRRAPVTAAKVSPIQCRFFPACSNLNCPFFHPKPCRFGLACKNKELGCPFYHPSLPGKDKLTWAAPAKGASATSKTVSVAASTRKSL